MKNQVKGYIWAPTEEDPMEELREQIKANGSWWKPTSLLRVASKEAKDEADFEECDFSVYKVTVERVKTVRANKEN